MKALFKASCLRSAFAGILCLFSQDLLAGVEPTLSQKKQGPSQLTVNAEIVVEDEKYTCLSSSSCSPAFTTTKLENAVVLGIDQDYEQCVDSFGISFTLELKYYLISAPTTLITKNITLSLSYDPKLNRLTEDKSIYRLENAVKLTTKILSVSSSLTANAVPGNIYIENLLSKERYYAFSCSATPASLSIDSVTDGFLDISWASVTGAEEYDLEWIYIDDFKEDAGSSNQYFSTSELEYSFKNDGTRVTVKGTSFQLRNLYEHGYLLFRVRAVGSGGAAYKQRLEGAWTSDAYSGNLVSNFSARYFNSAGHETLLNWQWNNTFAEEGKYKSVISYADGTLRSRQVVTAVNSDEQTVVGESVYDHLGRKAVDILPSPTGENLIKFYPDFNLSDYSGDPYNWTDFDTINSFLSCANSIRPLSTSSGASRYYSPSNPDQNLYQAYVPDAQKYPFAVTEYMPDNTGRVRRQSGVGPDHTLGSGHETRYYYSGTSQFELDRLFGVEAGYADRYKKNMVVDANGTVSVSYINARGAVVATALAGEAPANLQTLDTSGARDTVIIDMVKKSFVDPFSQKIVAYHSFMLTSSSLVSIDYKMRDLVYERDGCGLDNICFDCSYDLKIYLMGECGDTLHKFVQYNIHPFDTLCVSDSFTHSKVLGLPLGTYSLYKELSVNQEALDRYADIFIERNTCIRPLDSIYSDMLAQVDFTGCYNTCDSCLSKLGTLSAYISSQASKYGLEAGDDSVVTIFTEEYNDQYEDCKLLCNSYSPCEVEKNLLMQDVSPGGQYFLVEISGGSYIHSDALSFAAESTANTHIAYNGETRNWKNSSITYHDENGEESLIYYQGNWVKPNALPLDTFLVEWRSSWAEDLMPMHPEYCYYKWCLENDSSNYSDIVFSSVETFAEALSDSLLNTAGTVLVAYPEKKDNYFKPGKYGYSQLATMQSRMTNYSSLYGNTYNIYQAAAIMAACPHAASAADITACLAANPFGSGSTDIKNMQWQYYKNLYLGLKNELFDARRTQYAVDSSCRNCYIASSGYLNPDSCSGNTAFRRKERLFKSVLDASKMDLSIAPESNMSTGRELSDSALGVHCKQQCELYAERWMRELDSCYLDSADSLAIRNGLIEVCRKGCGYNNSYGASSIAPDSAGGNRSFADVLLSVLGPGYRTKLCNEDMISWPLGFNHSYEQSDAVTADSCFMEGFVDILQDSFDCDLSEELYAIRDILSSLNDSALLNTNNSEHIFNEANTELIAWDQYVDFIRPHIIQSTDPVNIYHSSAVDVGVSQVALDAWFVGYDTSGRDSCKIRLFAPLAHPPTIFDSIASFGTISFELDSFDIFCNRNYSSGSFRLQVTLLNSSTVTLRGYSECFPMCRDKGTITASRISNIYLNRYCIVLDTHTINDLLNYLCDSTYLPAVPRELSCKPRCITCDRYSAAKSKFISRYSGVYTVTDSSWKQRGFSTVYTNFMNSELGMNLSFDDFDDFDNNCDSFYETAIDPPGDLTLITDPYTYLRYLRVKNGCDTSLPNAIEDTLFTKLTLCDKTVDEIVQPDPNPCATALKESAFYNAQKRYNFILDSMRAEFRKLYAAQCLSMVNKEIFTLSHDIKEYHFTLYYYDQAGNLIKTVPPNGVAILTSPHKFTAIEAYRANPDGPGTTFTIPEHLYVSNYKYTTLEQVYEQSTPDGRTVNFFYDHLGRLVISQNQEQALSSKYSYTKYDDLGRITEVGQLQCTTALTFDVAKDEEDYNSWFNAIGTNKFEQITSTVYEDRAGSAVQDKFGSDGQENLRNRVSSISYDDNGNGLPEYQTYYTYDLHGNVKTLLQYYDQFMQVNEGYFKTDYSYDLISGNVNKVSYQEGEQDQFFHKYQYDADNRLTHAYTSRDNFIWDNDAQYFYYQHGPMARAEIGQLKVQGMDYAYTIHGWLKGVNSATLDSSRDIGADAWNHVSNVHRYIPKDLFGFTLGYYQGDYKEIAEYSAAEDFEINCTASQGIDAASPSLFNGNIRHMLTAIGKFMEGHAGNSSKPLATAYKYDQLNRLLSMWVYDSINMSSNTWYSVSNALPQYHNRFTYDGNGNILTQVRRGSLASGLAMDSLDYIYSTNKNILRKVTDGVSSSAYSDDIDHQSSTNYDYDLAGNLVSDISGKIDQISWNVYGKIRSIIPSSSSTRPRLDFTYGPGGHRLSKKVTKGDTISTEFYVRDAQGNILATYTLTNAFFQTLDTSYQRVIERLVDSVGIESFAGFMKARFASNSTFYTSMGTYKPSSSMITSLVDNGLNICIGNRIYGEIFGCCDNCSETHNRDLYNELVTDATSQNINLVNLLLNCNPEPVIEGLLKTYDSVFLHRFWADSGLSVLYNYFRTRYQPVHPTYISYLRNDVPVAELAWYFAYKLGAYYSLSNSGMNSRIMFELSTTMGLNASALNTVMRKHFPPCQFLECMKHCFASETGDLTRAGSCSNGSVAQLSSRYSSYINAWNPAPNYASLRTSIASHTWTTMEFNTVSNCDPSAFLLAALKYNATNLINDYNTNYGSISGIVTWFLGKYPYPNPASPLSNTAYLATVVPKEELAWYMVYVQGQPLPGGFTTWLNGLKGTIYANSDIQTILGTHYADCDIKKCIITNGILGSLSSSVPLASWLASNKTHFMLSAGDLCLPGSYSGLINRSTAYLMAGKAVRCSEDLRRDMLNKYPYYSLMMRGLEDDHSDMIAKLKLCNYEGFFKALLHTSGREFLTSINSSSSGTITSAVSNFNGTYIPNPMVDNIDYLLKQVPIGELAAWFNAQSYDYTANAASLANDVIARALKARYQECDFRSCLVEEWVDENLAIQFDSLIDWYKQNYWTNVLSEVYTCSSDSFTYFTSYNQRSIVAEIFEEWHLPMKDFMTEIQTHYGSGIKNWLNLDTLRHYQYAKLNELHIYGSSRLGTLNVSDTVYGGIRLYNFDLSTGDTSVTYDMAYEDYYTLDSAYKFYRGDRSYEGSNHLGNVLVVFSDKRIPICSSGTVYKYQADLKQATHYSAFGAPMPDLRWYASSSEQYDFGYQGSEQTDEVYSDGNEYTTEFRQMDVRLGRWMSIDPLTKRFPWQSPYVAMDNIPTILVDRLGLNTIYSKIDQEIDNANSGNSETTSGSASSSKGRLGRWLDQVASNRFDRLIRQPAQQQFDADVRNRVFNPTNRRQYAQEARLLRTRYTAMYARRWWFKRLGGNMISTTPILNGRFHDDNGNNSGPDPEDSFDGEMEALAHGQPSQEIRLSVNEEYRIDLPGNELLGLPGQQIPANSLIMLDGNYDVNPDKVQLYTKDANGNMALITESATLAHNNYPTLNRGLINFSNPNNIDVSRGLFIKVIGAPTDTTRVDGYYFRIVIVSPIPQPTQSNR